MEKFEAIPRELSETSSAVSDIQNGKDGSGRSVQPNLTGESERQTGKVAQSVLSNAYRTESNLPGFGEFPKLRPNVLVVPPRLSGRALLQGLCAVLQFLLLLLQRLFSLEGLSAPHLDWEIVLFQKMSTGNCK